MDKLHHHFYTKKGNLKECSNYRTISLISHPSKIMLRILLTRLQPRIEGMLAEEQAGFRKNRSTVEQIFNLRQIVERYLEHQLSLFTVFIDFKKAFDRVWQEALWATMHCQQFPKQLTDVIENLYKESTCQVLHGSQLSESFPTTVGVRQGCLLSPSLFNLYLEEILNEALENADEGAVIGGRKIARFQFADDIALLSNTEEEVQDLVTRLDRTSRRFGMIISWEKQSPCSFAVQPTKQIWK